MKLHELKPAQGSVKTAKRVGRGAGSGWGKTSGRGHKGQLSRSGGGTRIGFEGGQMPLTRRIPKKGFRNIFSKEYATINVASLNAFEDDTVIDIDTLIEAGMIKKPLMGLKILGDGELEKRLVIKAKKFTGSAKEKIEAHGGKAEVI